MVDNKLNIDSLSHRKLPPWLFVIFVLVRAVHLLSASVILATILFDLENAVSGTDIVLKLCLINATLSGFLLMVNEIYTHPGYLHNLSIWIVFAKLSLLGLALVLSSLQSSLIATAFILAIMGAHMPKHWRRWRLF